MIVLVSFQRPIYNFKNLTHMTKCKHYYIWLTICKLEILVFKTIKTK